MTPVQADHTADPAADDSQDMGPDLGDFDANHMHNEFEQWSHWCATRRYYAPAHSKNNLLARLSSQSRPHTSNGGPNALCSARMVAIHHAILGQPENALDTQVFWAYYGYRVKFIKQAASGLGISRQHFYRLLKCFGQRVKAAADAIEADNLAANKDLPHYTGPLAEVD
ncbi:MAG: hypothetical protein Q7U52_11715 [Hydrogenophaga sp.]|nr:hypothetical protein [Hydrogenophaga sp.]